MADAYDMQLAYLDNFYSSAIANPQRIVYGSGYPGFNDTAANWSVGRIQHRQCGQTWLTTMRETGKYYSASNQLKHLQVVTWNDLEEGTAIEPGIDSCLDVFAWMSGSTLNWKLVGRGSPETVGYFSVFISTDGQNLMKLANPSASARSLSLSGYGLSSSTTYTLYVKMEGKPSIQNQISGPVTYRPGNAPPTVKLVVSPASGLAPLSVSVSTSGSIDGDGSVSSSRIDFGDGVVLSGPTASHTYTQFGTYTVTARVYDNRGVASIATAIVKAKPPRSGVILWSPQPASNIANSFDLLATASPTGSYPITAIKLYVDSKAVLLVRGDRIDTRVKLFDGWHNLAVNAWDSAGAVSSAQASVLVGIGPNTPPNLVLQLTNLSPAVGQTVRACTAQSSDSSGISSSFVDFGDGTAAMKGTTTYHSYTSAGTYTVKATISDGRGAVATTSTTVMVH